jgi:CTP-dependent riboflavin kinase
MSKGWKLTGKIVSGVKQAARFTNLDWVQKQCMEKLGFKPYPGTLNLEIAGKDLKIVEALQRENAIAFISPDPQFCNAMVFPISIGGISGAIVLPEEKVRLHGKNIVEVISHLRLKEALHVADGDRITLIVGNPKSQQWED